MKEFNNNGKYDRSREIANQIANAFPTPAHSFINDGMTLRDYFAAKAMQALITQDSNMPDDKLAKYSYDTADAMLKARGEK